ncbi:TPA: hypothetical protein P2N00_000464 [Aeromonas salmonicida]|nr:hypothetical protein [Aeromonas salmonicida]HDN9816767.1 hypothetical protein [Aeromonas salmonicida]HDN9821366.1 hypothetical protein [Aeromonas salmonicida]HDN9839567.1 hypothetical protein [Aeromonas salmonicida]HDO0874650.1 hypothetical protein [Aeromonas salmonicida]
MSEFDPVILAEVNRGNSLVSDVLSPLISGISGAVIGGVTPAVGMSAQLPSTKPMIVQENTEWLRSGVLIPQEGYVGIPDYLTQLGPGVIATENGVLPSSVNVVSTASIGALVVFAASSGGVYVSKDRGLTCLIASGVSASAVFECNGFIYASNSGSLRRTSNGDTWEYCTGVTGAVCGIAYGNGVYIAPSSDSTNVCWTSSDGFSFAIKLTAPAAAKTSICFANGLFFLSTTQSSVVGPSVSNNGESWFVATLYQGASLLVHLVISAADRIYAFTNAGIFETLDATQWIKIGIMPSSYTATPNFPRGFYQDGLLGVLSSSSVLMANHPSALVSITFGGAAHAACISGDYLIAGLTTPSSIVHRRKLGRVVGNPRYISGIYYRVK